MSIREPNPLKIIFIFTCFIWLCFLFFPLHLRCIELPSGVPFPSRAGCDGPHTHTHTRFLYHISAHMARQPLFEWEPTLQALFCGFFTFQPHCQIIVYVPLTAQSQFVPTNVALHYGTLEICVYSSGSHFMKEILRNTFCPGFKLCFL